MFGKPNVAKLKEKKEYEKLGKLLTHSDKNLRVQSAAALLDVILARAYGNDYDRKFDIARMFQDARDEEILTMLLERAAKYGTTGTPEQRPLIRAILFAHGFDALVDLLAQRGRGNLVGDWFQDTLSTELFSYAAQLRLDTLAFAKIIPNAKCQFSNEYFNAYQYFQTLPKIKLPKDQIDEINNLIEKRIKETSQDHNIVVAGNNRMDKLLLEKIMPA
jgi:hypothetical protein